jgi:hypothetical protein
MPGKSECSAARCRAIATAALRLFLLVLGHDSLKIFGRALFLYTVSIIVTVGKALNILCLVFSRCAAGSGRSCS